MRECANYRGKSITSSYIFLIWYLQHFLLKILPNYRGIIASFILSICDLQHFFLKLYPSFFQCETDIFFSYLFSIIYDIITVYLQLNFDLTLKPWVSPSFGLGFKTKPRRKPNVANQLIICKMHRVILYRPLKLLAPNDIVQAFQM